jgi:nucleoside-diphosphate-sugar epimerase
MRVLVTGTSGRIGSAIARFLKGKVEVIGLDNRAGPHTSSLTDVREKVKLFTCIKEVDAVIHTAALLTPQVNVCSDEEFWEVNVRGTENLLEACIKYNVKRFVFTSTTSIYGNAMIQPQRAVWVSEELSPQPRDIYDTTKIAAEKLCREACENGLSCLSLRMSRCFPERDELMAIYRLYRGVDVQDVVRAHELALNSTIRGYEVVNISSQSPFQQSDIEELHGNADHVITRYFPWAEKAFLQRGWSLPKIIDSIYVIEKAKKLLGYKPCHNFSEQFLNDREGNGEMGVNDLPSS